MRITNFGLDIAKNVFQVHGVDVSEHVVVRKAALAWADIGVFRGSAALSGRRGGMCYGPSSETGAYEAWP